jgi:hypothetical protein
MAAVMTGSTQEDYAKMMLGGGRSVEGNRSKSGLDAPKKASARKAAPRKVAAKPAAKSKSPAPKRSKKAGSKRG